MNTIARTANGSKPALSRFGTPASIDPARLFLLPIAMQREGVLLLLEMGQSVDQVAARLKLSSKQVARMAAMEVAPFQRGGEQVSADAPPGQGTVPGFQGHTGPEDPDILPVSDLKKEYTHTRVARVDAHTDDQHD